jgi:hypothetical protein
MFFGALFSTLHSQTLFLEITSCFDSDLSLGRYTGFLKRSASFHANSDCAAKLRWGV